MALPVSSKSQTTYDDFATNINMLFLLIMAVDVYFMQCGFLILECGAIPRPDMTSMLMKNVLNSFVGSLSYWILGYGLAFGDGDAMLGYSHFALHDASGAIWAHWFFQLVFAATTATIVSGAIAENCHPIPYAMFSFVITGFMYPVVTHWAWSGQGWLSTGITGCCDCSGDSGATSGNSACNTTFTVGYQDFAGSGVVHLLGGTTALVGAILLGHRRKELQDKSQPPAIPAHTVPLAVLGAFILYFGFLAFNGGSQGQITNPGDAEMVALAMVNTFLSGSVAGLTSLLTTKWIHHIRGGVHEFSFLVIINGSLTGMVSACASCNMLYPWAATIVGVVAGLTYKIWSFIIIYYRIDDPLEAVPVHAGGGLWGLIAASLLSNEGVFQKFGPKSLYGLAWNLTGAVVIIIWAGGWSLFMFGMYRIARILHGKVTDGQQGNGSPGPQQYSKSFDLFESDVSHRPETRGKTSAQQFGVLESEGSNTNANYDMQHTGPGINHVVSDHSHAE